MLRKGKEIQRRSHLFDSTHVRTASLVSSNIKNRRSIASGKLLMKSNLSIFALSIRVRSEGRSEWRREMRELVLRQNPNRETGERKIEREEITKRRDRKDVKIKLFVEGLGFSKFENRR